MESAGRARMPEGGAPRVIGGRYEVVRTLGVGAAGRTFLCVDRQEARQVALKELHVHQLEDWKQLELFEREASVLSRLDHPAVPDFLDYFRGTEGAETLYIAQAFVEGLSLLQRIDQGPMLGRDEVRVIALGLLDVLDYLHGRVPPVIHRDIKPSNVLIRPGGEVMLVDFGGVWFGWRPSAEMGHTAIGSFGYMPPEQLVGQAAPTSDLYALGATLLHAITGRPPGDFSLDSGRIEIPEDLPVAPGLARMIEAVLRPAPRDRPRSAADARSMLLQDSVATPAPYPEPRWVHRPVAADYLPAEELSAEPPRRSPVTAYGPRFVDPGPPPRDPKGHLKDVYSNLMNPLYPARRSWSAWEHGLWILLSGMLSAVSLGIATVMYVDTVRTRGRRYAGLFRTGVFTRGTVLAAERGPIYATFQYAFETPQGRHRGTMEYAQEMTRFWVPGEAVAVLYDPSDPTHSCLVYR